MVPEQYFNKNKKKTPKIDGLWNQSTQFIAFKFAVPWCITYGSYIEGFMISLYNFSPNI